MNSFKLYHNSTKNENIIIRSLNFHPVILKFFILFTNLYLQI